jgi:predicted ferric reductase
MLDIRSIGLFSFGIALLALAFYILISSLRDSNWKEKINSLTSFLALILVSAAVFFLAAQLLYRKC